jgi:hypothetical protein
MIELKNEQLTIRVAEKGAELQSVKDADGREYMWQAGPEWSRHSPILFPIVCSVNDNTYRVDGKEYHLSRHGFARDAEFTVVSQGPQKVTLTLHDSEDTLKVYPYHFNLAISYKLEGPKIQVIWHVEQETVHARMITDVVCDKADMLLIRYEAPDGQARHTRLWNGGNGRGTVQLFERAGLDWKLVDILDAAHMGCEYGEYDATEPY